MNKEVESIQAEENTNSELLAASTDDKGNKATLVPVAKGKSAAKSISPASKSSKVGAKFGKFESKADNSLLIPQSGYLIIKIPSTNIYIYIFIYKLIS